MFARLSQENIINKLPLYSSNFHASWNDEPGKFGLFLLCNLHEIKGRAGI